MKRGTPEHPKTALLMGFLQVPKYIAVGILESLWHFTARYAPTGDIGKWTDEMIAAAIGWELKPSQLISGLVKSGWLHRAGNGQRLIVHDWHDHCDQTTKRYITNNGLTFASENYHKLANDEHTVPVPVPVPVPKPKPKPSSPPKKSAGGKPREKNLIWDRICEIFGLDPVTKSEKSRIGKIVRDLKLKKATPDEIGQRGKNYKLHWPNAAFTPEALTKHWDTMKDPPGEPFAPPWKKNQRNRPKSGLTRSAGRTKKKKNRRKPKNGTKRRNDKKKPLPHLTAA